MIRKQKLVIFIPAVTVCIIIAALSVKLMKDHKYRSQLPPIRDLNITNESLREQIYSANKKAHLFPTSDNLGSLGMVYNSGAFYDQAAMCYQLAVNRNKNNWIWNYYLGYLKLEFGDSKSAINYFSEVIKNNPRVYMALYYTGEAYQNLNITDTAEIIFKKIAGSDEKSFVIGNKSRTPYFPLNVYAEFHLAGIKMNSNLPDSAVKKLNEIITDQINFGPAYRQLARIYESNGDSLKSRYYYSRANDLIIYTPPVDTLVDKLAFISRSDIFLIKQIDLAIRSANNQWALTLLSHGLKYIPNNKYLISKAIKQSFYSGNGYLSLPYLTNHLKYFSDDYEELKEVGCLLADAGFKTQAIKYFIKAESLKQETPEARSLLALYFFEKVRMKENAVTLISEETEKNPGNIKVLSNAIYLYLEMGEKDKAFKHLNRLKQISPSNPNLIIFDGLIAEEQGNLTRAISLFEQAYEAIPKDKFLLGHLGEIYLREKMWLKAIGFFRKALEYFPNDSYVQANLGGLLVSCPDEKLRNLKEGREYSERAYINCKNSPPTYIYAGKNLAIAYKESGDRMKASFYISKTIELANESHLSKKYLDSLDSLSKQISGMK